MKRDLIPGRWSRTTGRAIRDPQACELDNHIAPRSEFPAPPDARTAEDDAYRARALLAVIAVSLGSWLALGFLLWARWHK